MVLLLTLLVVISSSGCDLVESDEGHGVDNQDVLATASLNETVGVTTQDVLYLQNVNGDVAISRLPRSGSVEIAAELIAGSESLSDAERWLEKLQVRINKQTQEVKVATDFPKDSEGRRLEVRYQIRVPEGFDVRIVHVNGAITIDDLVGHVDVDHVNGRVEISNLHGTVDVALVNGTVDCTVYLSDNGFAFFDVVNGKIELNIPKNTSAKLHAGTANGQVRFRDLSVLNESGNARERSGTMGRGNGQIELKVTNGDIDVSGM
jgi:DUF4097 and DUF4098 domain-containing protein YvlB